MATELIPLEILFGEPRCITPQISPDGSRLAYLAPLHGVLNLWVRRLDCDQAIAVTRERARGIVRYFWAPDGRRLLYLLDRAGDEHWRLLSANIDGEDTRELVAAPDGQVSILGESRSSPNELLVGLDGCERGVSDVYRLDLKSGALKLVLKNPGNVAEWICDRRLLIRAAMASRDDGGFDLMVVDAATSNGWRRIVAWSAEDSLTSSPVAVTENDSLYVIDSRRHDTSALVEMSFDGTVRSTIARDKQYDVGRVMVNPETGVAEAVAFYRDRNEWDALVEGVRKDFRALRGIASGDFYVISRDYSDLKWIIAFLSDTRPVAFYLYERARSTATFLFEHEPRLVRYALARTEPVSFPARDGLTLRAYLTRPVHSSGPVPLVLKIHSGPWIRDEWGFDPHVQWFANRGCACLQVNFRGSAGYGKHFLNAGNREWGGRMQDDLVDSLLWAIERRVTTPKRIAAFGISYGGYAALMLAAFHSELLACAVDIAGPTDLIEFIRTTGDKFGNYRHVFTCRIGDPYVDGVLLRSRSPIAHAERINVPVFLAHGDNDPRVPKDQSERLVAALATHHVPHEYLVLPDEGHGVGTPVRRLELYTRIERFLVQHLFRPDTDPATA